MKKDNLAGDDAELTLWLRKIVESPDEAMERIWGAYFEKLVGYAQRKLGGMPRRMSDAEDIAACAMQSFCRQAKADQFPNLRDRDDLWKLLLTITARKAGKEIRRNLAQKRGGGDVRGESVFMNAHGEPGPGLEGVAEPTEAFGELFADELLTSLDRLADDRLREIAVRKMEGFTNGEIAAQLECAVRTVERKLERIRSMWKDGRTD